MEFTIEEINEAIKDLELEKKCRRMLVLKGIFTVSEGIDYCNKVDIKIDLLKKHLKSEAKKSVRVIHEL